jgi:hypothetical protein
MYKERFVINNWKALIHILGYIFLNAYIFSNLPQFTGVELRTASFVNRHVRGAWLPGAAFPLGTGQAGVRMAGKNSTQSFFSILL